jgi:superoxide dismutase, Cu-Zn family
MASIAQALASEVPALGGGRAIRRSSTEGTMTRLTIAGALLASVSLLAGPAHAQPKATAEIRDASGKVLGEALLEQRDGSVEIDVTLTGLPKGTHAFHIHEAGRCDPPFESAGGHFNPHGKKHGKDNPGGPHAGDMPNIEVSDSGRVKMQVMVKGVSLDGGPGALLDGDGASLVVHEGADDYKTDPAGNSGKRLACGVIHR